MRLFRPDYSMAAQEAAAQVLAEDPWDGQETDALAAATEALRAYLRLPPSHDLLLTNSCTTALSASVVGASKPFHMHLPPLSWGSSWTGPLLTRPGQCQYGSWCWHPLPWNIADDPCGYVLAVSLYGNVPRPSANRIGSTWVLDAAHSFPLKPEQYAEWDAVCHSFGPAKQCPLIRGGCIIYDTRAMDGLKMRRFLESGTAERAVIQDQGMNGRMDWVNASMLPHQLEALAGAETRRRYVLDRYESFIDHGRMHPLWSKDHAHIAAVQTPEAIRLRDVLDRCHIPHGRHYPAPYSTDLATAHFAQHEVTLPLHSAMSQEEVDMVCAALRLM